MLIFKKIIPAFLFIILAKLVSAQSVGIGTSTFTPGSMLSVSGNLSVGTYSTTAAPSNGLIVSGNVGIGTSTVNAQLELPQNVALKVGDFYLSSGGNYAHMSDNNWYNGSAWSSNNENRVGSLIQLTSGGVNFYTTSAGAGVPTFTSIFAISSSGTITIPGGSPGAGKVLVSDASGVATWSSSASAQLGTQTVYTSGSTAWVCPSGVYKISIELWGGGGGGCGSPGGGGDMAGPGGGGGEYVKDLVSVTPGTTYYFTVGAGGSAGAGASAGACDETSGSAGGNSCMSTSTACGGSILARAYGGSGGTKGAVCSAGTGGAGGNGGTGFQINGSAGDNGTNSTGGIGSSGGSSTVGAGATGTAYAAGSTGSAPGGGGSGGGGGGGSTAGRAGGAGAAGRVVIIY